MNDWLKRIQFKSRTCSDINGKSIDISNQRAISMYVVLTRKCNAHCEFCEFNTGKNEISVNIFEDMFREITRYCDIPVLHFTGGEPTLELDKLIKISKIVKQVSPLTTISVNTNGIRLNELSEIDEVDNIALSRHALTDEENIKIFGTNTVASEEVIKQNKHKEKLHLSCNLIKGYIDSQEKIISYLEKASELGINDIGLVSLMKVNNFCNERYISFKEICPEQTDRFINNRCFSNINNKGELCCKCENYLYRANNLKLISVYHRYAIRNSEIADYLVFENNQLKQGFNGEVIK